MGCLFAHPRYYSLHLSANFAAVTGKPIFFKLASFSAMAAESTTDTRRPISSECSLSRKPAVRFCVERHGWRCGIANLGCTTGVTTAHDKPPAS